MTAADDALQIDVKLNPVNNEAVIVAAQTTAKRMQAEMNKINAEGPKKQMKMLEDTIQSMGGAGKLAGTQLQIMTQRAEQFARAGAAIPASLQPAIDSYKKLQQAAADQKELTAGLLDKAGLGALAGAGPAAGAFLAVGAMAGASKETFDLIKASAELADTIGDLSVQYQVSTDEIQTWMRIAKDGDVTVQQIGQSTTNLAKILENSPDKFKEWGMDVEALRAMAPEQLLGAMSEKVQTLNGQQRLAFVEDLKIANELLPALVSGFDGVREAAAGSITPLSPDELKTLNDTKDAIQGIGVAWSEMWLEVGNALGSDQQVQEFFTSIREGLVDLVKTIAENREDLAWAARTVAALANPGGTAGSWAGSKLKDAGSAASAGLTRWWAGARSGFDPSAFPATLGVNDTIAGGGMPSGGKIDLAAIAAAKASAQRAAEAADKLASARGAEEMKVWQEFIHSLEAGTKAASADTIKRLQTSTSSLLGITPGFQQDVAMGPGADVKKRSFGWDTAGLIKDVNVVEREIYQLHKPTMEWSQFLQDAANQFQLMGASGQAIGKILGGFGGIGAVFSKGGALDGVKGIGDIFKGSGGEILKKLSGGLTAAFAAIDMGKMLYSMFHKTEAQKVAFDVGRDYGVQISEGLSKEIAAKSKTMGREAASLLSLDKIVGEGGGVQAFGLDKTIGKMRDLFSMVQTGKATVEQARKPFDALFGEVAQSSISKTSGLVSAQVMELMQLNKQLGLGSEAVSKFQDEQRGKASEILGRLLNNKDFEVSGQAAGNAYGNAIAAAYERMVEQGMSGAEIADKLGPQIDAFQKKLEAAGVTGGAAYEGMAAKMAMFTDEVTGPTASALQDQISLMVALSNAGDLSRDDFVAMSQSVGETFTALQAKLTAQGQDPNGAFKGMQKDLQKLWEMQQRFGVAVDPTTQGILDKAQTDGLIGKEFMDPVVSELVTIGDTLKVIARQGGATEGDLAGSGGMAGGGARGGSSWPAGAAFPQPTLPVYDSGAAFAAALSDVFKGGGFTGGMAGNLELSPASISALAAAMAGQPIEITSPAVNLDGNAIAGGITQRIERGAVPGMVTALQRKLDERS